MQFSGDLPLRSSNYFILHLPVQPILGVVFDEALIPFIYLL